MTTRDDLPPDDRAEFDAFKAKADATGTNIVAIIGDDEVEAFTLLGHAAMLPIYGVPWDEVTPHVQGQMQAFVKMIVVDPERAWHDMVVTADNKAVGMALQAFYNAVCRAIRSYLAGSAGNDRGN